MQLSLIRNRVISLSIIEDRKSIIESDSDGETNSSEIEGKAEFSFNVFFEEKSFFVLFTLELNSLEGHRIKLVYKSIFHTDEEINESFKSSRFAFINAPAIAYPFLRAYISTITLNSGLSPVMLPSVNFIHLWEEKEREKNSVEEIPES